MARSWRLSASPKSSGAIHGRPFPEPMQRLPNSPVQFQLGVRGWAAVAVGLVIVAALALLTIGFFIVLLPLLLLAPILFWILPKPKIYRVPPQNPPASDGTVIE